jgi:uncharacterized membrane protein
MELWKLLGDLHPKLVQFPLVLLLSGLVFDAVGLIRRSRRFHWAAVILSSAGTVLLLFAFICGIYAEIWAGRAGVPQDPIEWHEFVANLASWGFVILMAWRLVIPPRRRRALTAYTTIGLFYYVLLGLTAYLGGQLVFNYGAAVAGARANTVHSLHDLNTLATRQTDLNLRYSEMMHHIFGWMTLAMSGSLLAAAVFRNSAHRVRWVGPLLLLLGGIFLFFCADLDLYRLTDLRQWGDREVELHKTIAVLLIVIGGAGLRRNTTRRRSLRYSEQPDSSTAPNPALRNTSEAGVLESDRGSKPIAIMALVGGGLLFTHVHTVAPYANVAAGVYIAHVVLGLVALSIGATRLLQDGIPKYRHAFATAFAVLMCIESILLITYNEGLPWYIGYGTYNRWGPHGGTVAPYGDIRAELTFDNASQTLDVFTLDRFRDQAVSVPAHEVELLIGHGYQEVAVPLDATDRSQSHFNATAPWLKDAPAFSARLALPTSRGNRIGYFDPWVAPVIAAVPPNEVARFQCPMHDGVLSEKPGVCPVCGMDLVPIQAGVRTILHDPPFGLQFTTQHQFAQTADLNGSNIGQDDLQLRLSFTPQRSGELLHNLPVVHEHPLHLTILSADLSFFDHVHPVPQKDGSLQIDYHFPRAGRYLLFAEYFPTGQRDQVFRFPLIVGQTAEADDQPASLEVTPASIKPVEGHSSMTAELVTQPRTLTAGTHAMLLFRLADHGQPITDLEPYMGAMGHCAILSQDTNSFLHCHPEQLYPTAPDSRGGPDIAFHTAFPKPGLYKIWAQFKRGGKVVIADFVVEVKSPLLPAKVVNFILNGY